jgi:hypothetical protein
MRNLSSAKSPTNEGRQMPINQRRAELSSANLMIFSGRVAGKELLAEFGAIGEGRDDSSNNWLILDMFQADISELTFDVLARLKMIMKPKMLVMKARREFDVAIVCTRPFNEPIYLTWKSFVDADLNYPSNPQLFPNLRSACDYLGYSDAEYDELSNLLDASRR